MAAAATTCGSTPVNYVMASCRSPALWPTHTQHYLSASLPLFSHHTTTCFSHFHFSCIPSLSVYLISPPSTPHLFFSPPPPPPCHPFFPHYTLISFCISSPSFSPVTNTHTVLDWSTLDHVSLLHVKAISCGNRSSLHLNGNL